MDKILNLTQHVATDEQRDAGVMEPADKAAIQTLLTFRGLPEREEIARRAAALAEQAREYETAMIGGAPYLMGPLEQALRARGVAPVYAYSERVSVDVHNPDGSVTKQAVFKHAGFVRA